MILKVDNDVAINTEDIVMVERKAFANPPEGMPPVWTYIFLRGRNDHIAVTEDIFDKVVACSNTRQQFPIKG